MAGEIYEIRLRGRDAETVDVFFNCADLATALEAYDWAEEEHADTERIGVQSKETIVLPSDGRGKQCFYSASTNRICGALPGSRNRPNS